MQLLYRKETYGLHRDTLLLIGKQSKHRLLIQKVARERRVGINFFYLPDQISEDPH